MNFPHSREQLAAACEDELRRLGVPVQWLDVALDGDERWAVTLMTGGRTFHFGTLGAGRYCFEEWTGPQPVDFVRPQPPASRAPAVLWAYSFFLLGRALADPHFRGIEPSIL